MCKKVIQNILTLQNFFKQKSYKRKFLTKKGKKAA